VKAPKEPSELLDAVLTVVGSLFNVKLAVVNDTPAPAPAAPAAKAPAAKSARASKAAPAKRATRATSTARPPRKAAAKKSSSGPSAAQMRAWASEQGMSVPSRGPIPASVRTAYEAAH